MKRKFVRRQEARGAALAEEAAEVKGQRSELAGREAELARRLHEHADAAAECRVGTFCSPSACGFMKVPTAHIWTAGRWVMQQPPLSPPPRCQAGLPSKQDGCLSTPRPTGCGGLEVFEDVTFI